MKIRNDYVSNSSSSSVIVDEAAYDRFCAERGPAELSPEYIERDGVSCVEFYGCDSECSVVGYENDEVYVSELYDAMFCYNPTIIKWSNNH